MPSSRLDASAIASRARSFGLAVVGLGVTIVVALILLVWPTVPMKSGGVGNSIPMQPNWVVPALDRDVPCFPPGDSRYPGPGRTGPLGESMDGCPPELPTPDPAAAKSGVPLDVAALDVPLSHLGNYEIELGTAVLPNGYLSELSMELGNGLDGTYDAAPITLGLKLDPDGTMLPANVYIRGLTDGPELVHVVASFDLHRADPGAVMEIRNVRVR